MPSALPRVGRQGQGRRSGKSAGQERARRGGRALPVQADGLQGRVRGGAALCRRFLRQTGEERARRRSSALLRASRSAAAGAHRQDHRRAQEDDFRPLDLSAVFGCSPSSSSCAAPPSIHSAIRRNARPSAGWCATTRRCWRRCWPSSTCDNHHIAVGLAAIPEKIRGFGHVKMRHLDGRQGRRGGALRAVRVPDPRRLLKAAE